MRILITFIDAVASKFYLIVTLLAYNHSLVCGYYVIRIEFLPTISIHVKQIDESLEIIKMGIVS